MALYTTLFNVTNEMLKYEEDRVYTSEENNTSNLHVLSGKSTRVKSFLFCRWLKSHSLILGYTHFCAEEVPPLQVSHT